MADYIVTYEKILNFKHIDSNENKLSVSVQTLSVYLTKLNNTLMDYKKVKKNMEEIILNLSNSWKDSVGKTFINNALYYLANMEIVCQQLNDVINIIKAARGVFIARNEDFFNGLRSDH